MRLRATADTLTLSTFDYEVSAQASVPVVTDDDDAVLVPGRLLAEIVKALPPRPVMVETDGPRVTVKCGSSVFTLNRFPADEYPTLPDMPPVAGKVGADLLAAAISQVAVAAGKDDTLPGPHRYPGGDRRAAGDPCGDGPLPSGHPHPLVGADRRGHGRDCAGSGSGYDRGRPQSDQRGGGDHRAWCTWQR